MKTLKVIKKGNKLTVIVWGSEYELEMPVEDAVVVSKKVKPTKKSKKTTKK